MTTQKRKPQTPRELALYRVQASCRIGCDVLDQCSLPPPGVPNVEYALYNLLHAVSDLGKAMEEE